MASKKTAGGGEGRGGGPGGGGGGGRGGGGEGGARTLFGKADFGHVTRRQSPYSVAFPGRCRRAVTNQGAFGTGRRRDGLPRS